LPPDQPPQARNWKGILASTLLAAALAAGVWYLSAARWTSAKPLPRSEVAWWKFDEGKGVMIADSSGNKSRRSHPVEGDAGVLGRAVRLDGVMTAITGVDTARALPLGIAPRTLTAWVDQRRHDAIRQLHGRR